MKWGITKPNFRLIVCGLGIHKFTYIPPYSMHETTTRRECIYCGKLQHRYVNYGDERLISYYSNWS